MSDSSTIPGSPADEWANDGLAKLWAFLQAHGFEVLALIVLYMYLRPMMRNYFERKHREAVMKRATDPEGTKELREEMRRAREEQQKRWSERAAADAEELAHKKRQEKLKKAREARKKNASSFGNGGGPLNFGGGGGPARIIGGPSARYGKRGGG